MPPEARKNFTSLRTVLLSLFVVQVLVAAGLTSFISHRNSVNTVDEMASQLCSEIMFRVEQHLDNYLETAQSINQTNVRLARQGLLNIHDVTGLYHYFWEQGHMFQGLGTLAFANKEGYFIGANEPENYIVIADKKLTHGSIHRYAPTANGDISNTVLREKRNYDARKRGWYQKALAVGKPTWNEINPSVTGARLDLTATAPFYDNEGIFQGIFLIDVSLSNITEFLQSIQIGKTGQAFIIERDWNIVATSFKELPFVVENEEENQVRRIHAKESKSPLIVAAAEYLSREVVNLESISQHKRLIFTVQDKKYFLQIAPYQKHNISFLTIIILPEEDFMGHINKSNRVALTLICLAVAVAIILGVWMANWVINPIRKLSASAKALGEGRLDEHIKIERNDEVGELGRIFNSMAANLSETIEELRQENEYRQKTETAILETLNAAEDEKEKTKAIIAAIGDGISIQDTDYKVLYQNEIHKGMVGDHKGEYCFMAYEKRKEVCDGCPVAKSFTDGNIHRTERSLPFPDGTRYFEITTSPVRDSSGDIKAGIEVVRDVTDRKKAEHVLAEEKERLAVTLRSIGDGVITINIDSEVLFVNKVAEELTGWQQRDAVGRPLSEVFRIYDKNSGEPLGRLIDASLSKGTSFNLPSNTILLSRDGTERIIADSVAPIRDEESQPRGVVLVFRDVTQEVRTEQELLKIRKLESVGILAGGIAHDFNNILVAILGNLNLATQMLDKGHKVNPLLEDAVKASIRAKDLTSQLLTFAKGGNPVKELSSVADVVRESAQFVLHGAKTNCRFNASDDLWLADIDKGQISQVIQNIIINAQHAMPEGGTIDVSCANVNDPSGENVALDADRKYIKITIKDSGIGIPENLLEKIFDPYFTTKREGSGLGLAITHSIVEKHDGHITVWSKPGKGTSFCLYLPASSEAELPGNKQDEDTVCTKKGEASILLMDDDEMVRHTSANMLEFIGYQVVHAEDGQEAINLYKAGWEAGQPFDIIIMDLTIPGGMGGQEAVGEILKINPKAKVIVSSGYSNDPILAEYTKYGFKAAIVKPFAMKDLSSVIEQVLSG